MGACEAFYASALQHPWLLWLSALLAGAFALTRPRIPASARRYCAALVALSLADAWLTSQPIYGLGALGERARSLVPLAFVLAGDFRFLLLFGAATRSGAVAPSAPGIALAAGLCALVPLGSQLVLWLLPESQGGSRVLFLVYELLFVGLTLALLRWHPRVSQAPWLARVGRFVLLYYALWVCADLLILAGAREPGFALRVVPNVLYYGGLVAVIGAASARAATQAAQREV